MLDICRVRPRHHNEGTANLAVRRGQTLPERAGAVLVGRGLKPYIMLKMHKLRHIEMLGMFSASSEVLRRRS